MDYKFYFLSKGILDTLPLLFAHRPRGHLEKLFQDPFFYNVLSFYFLFRALTILTINSVK
jgi:hypothetical protein